MAAGAHAPLFIPWWSQVSRDEDNNWIADDLLSKQQEREIW
jgi:hypothetical protein